MVKVKICGVRTVAEAHTALSAGADFIGLNFYPPSPRYIEPAAAAEIVRELPDGVAVALLVNPSRETMMETLETTGARVVQLQGDEPPELCEQAGVKVIKAFRLGSEQDLDRIRRYKVWAALADAKTRLWGGSGVKGDWELSARAARMHERLFLAGGLDPENVAEAIAAVRPWAVDVCSGVESAPGVKDPDKIRRFMKAVRDATK